MVFLIKKVSNMKDNSLDRKLNGKKSKGMSKYEKKI